MLRRLHHDQPEGFAFTPANAEWAKGQIAKYPEGRQASAVIPLLWRAQEQEGWLSRPAIEHVADMLGMAHIRALEVATFYFMFQLKPVGSVAHIQVCGTTTCMICGAEDLVAVCKQRIAKRAFELSPDGKFSWEEVECLGACANAPMVQIGKDYYEDLDRASFGAILDALARGEVPRPGSARGRFASEPEGGLTSLTSIERTESANASVALAHALGDTLTRIDGTEQTASDLKGMRIDVPTPPAPPKGAEKGEGRQGEETERQTPKAKGRPAPGAAAPEPKTEPMRDTHDLEETEPRHGGREGTTPEAPAASGGVKPALYAEAQGEADDLKRIKGIGPKLEKTLNGMGVWHLSQIASWSPEEVAWMDANLDGIKGRVSRDDWVAQARVLADGGTTEFADRVARGEVASSKGDGDA